MTEIPRAAFGPPSGTGGGDRRSGGHPAAVHGSAAGHVVGRVAVALGAVFLGLAAVFAYAVNELEQDADQAEGVELTGSRGDAYTPLRGPATATYEDGVQVAVSAPRHVAPAPADGEPRPGARTYAFSVTYTNGSDAPLSFDLAYADPLRAWAGGAAREDEDAASLAVDLVNHEEAAAKIPRALAPGRSLTIPLRYRVPDGEKALTFMYGAADLRDSAYWELPLPG